MKNSLKLLRPHEEQIFVTIGNALTILFKELSNELSSTKKSELENDANFLNIFFIIFQLPYLSDPDFISEQTYFFYSLFKKISLDLQAKFVRILTQHRQDLSTYVSHVQQYITVRTFRWIEHTELTNPTDALLSSESGMHEGLNILRLLFYANLLAGERDTTDVIEIERDNDQKMEVELVKRRQRDGDDDDEDGDRQINEQGTSGEQTDEATSTSAGRQRSRSFTMRTSTSEQDEIESIYEHPLQIKLNLEPNEYRHGYLSFDDFINEFANEKLEISKEYLDFVRQRSGPVRFSFIFYPFFLSTINKTGKTNFLFHKYNSLVCLSVALLNIENKVQMFRHRHTSIFHSFFSGIHLNPFFKICVRREHLIEDALIAVC